MSSIRSSSTLRQRIQPITPIAPPIAPPYQTSPEPEKIAAEQVVLDLGDVVLDQVVAARADDAADERREHDLIRPVDRPAELAQAPRDDGAAGEEAERERDAERLDRDAQKLDFGLHGSGTGVPGAAGL